MMILRTSFSPIPAKVNEKMDKLRVADAMTEVFTIFKRCNKYIDETMPWALAKDEEKKDRLATVLYNLVEGISHWCNSSEILYAGNDRENPCSVKCRRQNS